MEILAQQRAKAMIFDSGFYKREPLYTHTYTHNAALTRNKEEKIAWQAQEKTKARSGHKQTNALHYFRKNINLS